MKRIVISEFKAKCIALLKEINRSGEPLTVTLRGKPIATIGPAATRTRNLGTQKDQTKTKGDIVQFDFSDDWERHA